MASATGALSGAASGAALGSFVPGIGTALGAGIGGLIGLFGGSSKKKESTFDPMSMYTDEQKKSVEALQKLASTGTGAGITLGDLYSGSLGDYTQSSGEQQALSYLQNLMSGDALTTAQKTLTDLATTTFNPDDPSSGYAAFSRALAKSGQESSDVLNREAAITGSRFGTGIQKQKADLAENLALQRGQFLANLYQQDQSKKLAGAQGLQSLVGTQANLAQQVQQQAAIQRQLNTAKAQAEYDEFKRSRNEQLSRIGLMQDQMQNPLAPVTTTSPSLFQQLLPSAVKLGTAYLSGGF